jgi:hypothetical protein
VRNCSGEEEGVLKYSRQEGLSNSPPEHSSMNRAPPLTFLREPRPASTRLGNAPSLNIRRSSDFGVGGSFEVGDSNASEQVRPASKTPVLVR